MSRTAYCSNCQKNVLLVREDIDIPLAIVLLIFTAGFGLFVYLVIYYNREENRCIHCHSIITGNQLDNRTSREPQQITYDNPYKSHTSNTNKNSELEKTKFCPNCGVKLSEQRTVLFCPYCGTNTNE
jgi:predicted RNA-binding Zn-ribbon protein involved in translation (DUF1610 family)